MTILPHHEPIVSTLKPGVITVRDGAGELKKFPIESGVLEVSGNRAVILL
jgi:F0F1-type ATP synthase epsilon subunit